MAVTSVTVTEGANATVPDTTSFPVVSTTEGNLPVVALGYVSGGSTVEVGTDASGVPVQGTTTITDLTVTTVNTPIAVGDNAAASVTLIAANANRKGWTVQNMSTADLYVRLGDPAALGTCHRVLRQYESMGQRIMDGDLYLGIITGRWASDAGGTAVGGDWE